MLRQINIHITLIGHGLIRDVILFFYFFGELLKGLIRVFKRRVLAKGQGLRADFLGLGLKSCRMTVSEEVGETIHIIIVEIVHRDGVRVDLSFYLV